MCVCVVQGNPAAAEAQERAHAALRQHVGARVAAAAGPVAAVGDAGSDGSSAHSVSPARSVRGRLRASPSLGRNPRHPSPVDEYAGAGAGAGARAGRSPAPSIPLSRGSPGLSLSPARLGRSRGAESPPASGRRVRHPSPVNDGRVQAWGGASAKSSQRGPQVASLRWGGAS